MSEPNPTCELLLRYLDDTLPSAERIRVETLLRMDPAARESYRSLAEHAVVIADMERVREANSPLSKQSRAAIRSDRQSNLERVGKALVVVAAVSLIAITVGQFQLGRNGESQIITINALNGPIQWTGDGGRITEELLVGAELPGGTIELMSAASWIEFGFRDKSTVTLSGQSTVTISEQTQKELHLKRGSLSANVKPQPAGRPMLVHTPSAELMILGTQFNVDAFPDTTWLAVNEGSVRLKRLADGQQVNVPARCEVAASMQDQESLSPTERSEAIAVWKSDLKRDVVRGKWVSELWMLAIKLKNSVAKGEMNEVDAMQEYKRAATLDQQDGSVWSEASPYGSLVVLSTSQLAAAPVLFSTNTKVRIKGQLHSSAKVKFGISTRNAEGGFAGKYSVSIAGGDLINAGETFEIELEMNQFENESESGNSPIGEVLSDWWCVTDAMSAKLEISRVEIVD